ncbi:MULTISPECIES: 50S ribosomal protein L25/general stress protein Ctc [unclassified Pseudonocardia]|uniref:50S ribosomal protein L25/general stress protein Ctc n=1 Tax=unclassified Pseudonocardia TaxID=2619320 RepID=UPI00095F12D8|nr:MULTISPECIES: 50S ribosomal protein L25/general stress protein Ctc [unclassified Pseudonocardia]MBN9101831.1 50S ribosomal protein L25/general stress protein Ctc [Pseudonocardia sp.]OJY42102.1 MAG: 50S ribosomal protein L25/general stress protein Ctc [Pseudonocardia sp. 73-21]
MAEAVIAAETRTEFGKGAARRTRRAGKIPAVLYGHGTDPQHLSLPELEFKRIVREQGRNAVITLDISGTPQLALTKTVVQHPIRPYIEHVDLLVIRRGEKVVVDVPIVVTGDAAPGTMVSQELNTLEVEADVSSIPDQIEVSVEGLKIGTQIQAGAIRLPANTTLSADAELLVVNVVAAPTEADLEAEIDTEGAGVVEEPSDEEQAAEASAEGGSEAASDSEG